MKIQDVFKLLPVSVLVLLFATSLNAQTEPAPAARPKPDKAKMAERYQKNADELAKELNLSEEQKAKFKQIDEDFAAKAKAARSSNKEEMTQLRAERVEAQKTVLTPEQAAKYDEIRAKKKAEMEEKKAQHQNKGGGKKEDNKQ